MFECVIYLVNRHSNAIISFKLKDSNVFVIATANDKHCLPDSLIRVGRFDKQILGEEKLYGVL